MDVEEHLAYSNLALNQHLNREKPDSPAFIRELVYGVLENKYYLDYVISQFVEKLSTVKVRERTLLRMGLYQLLFMKGVPAYAAVNESVSMARKLCRGKDGFINGVLRKADRQRDSISLPDPEADRLRYLSVKYSYEPWIIQLWIGQYGEEKTESLLAAGNGTPPLVLRANTLKMSVDELQQQLKQQGLDSRQSDFVPEGLLVQGSHVLDSPLYQQGAFSVQDESSMLAVDILEPRPGQNIVDVCAAPGGKTGFIAERMKNSGTVIAGDFYEKKLELIKKQMERTGVSIVDTRQWDAAVFQPDLAEWADGVLVDAPCSGLGVIRRKPEIKYKTQEQMPQELAGKQLQILEAASGYVKRGGSLVYSTCTISDAENRQVTASFLSSHKDFSMAVERQLLPDQDCTDGFYICKMIRN